MRFDVDPGSGATLYGDGTSYASSVGASLATDHRVRFGFSNVLEGATLADTIPHSGLPNPRSELGHSPLSNMFRLPVGELYEAAGFFAATSLTTKGIEQAGRYELKLQIGVTSITVDIRDTTPTDYWRSARELEAHLTRKIRAAAITAGMTGVFSFYFSDGRRGEVPTWKWTVSCTEAFFLLNTAVATSYWPVLGHIHDKDVTPVTSATGFYRACHSEEGFVFDVHHTKAYALMLEETEVVDRYRWLSLHGCNFHPASRYVSYEDAAIEKIHIYTGAGDTMADVEGVADSTFDLNHDHFKLWLGGDAGGTVPSLAPGVVEATDALLYPVPRHPDSHLAVFPDRYALPARQHLVDLGTWKYNWSPIYAVTPALRKMGINERWVKIKIVNPRNPGGHVKIGFAYLGAMCVPAYNCQYPYPFGPVDNSELLVTRKGGKLPFRRAPHREARPQWAKTFIRDQGQQIIDSLLARPYRYQPGEAHALVPNLATGGTKDRPFLYFDRTIGRKAHPGKWPASCGGLLLGRLEDLEIPTEFFNDLWNFGMTIREDVA